MNKFNISVKQKSKSIGLLFVIAIVALIICVYSTFIISANKASAEPSMADLQATLDSTSAAYFDAIAATSECQANVDEANSKIEYCNQKIPETQGKLETRAKDIYINGTMGILDLLLGASTIEELVNNIQMFTIMGNKDMALIAECRDLKLEAEQQKIVLDESLAEAQRQTQIASEAFATAQNALQAAQVAAAAAAAQQAESHTGGGGESGGGGGGGAHVGPVGNAIADRALGEQGKPYVWGGVGPDGYDCSGLVSYAVSGSHTRIGTTTDFMGYPRLSSPEVGCICTDSGHCGIYIGGGQMCHAPTFGQTVCCTGVQGGMIYVTSP